ncbi:hypothetical protein BJ741DRAFT_631550 [Chytriomyces cf. hyalinus JEL632]|nr:hypothetical protein BJ741DRAFT_631550 [Chytriomyces cf. hyalinus JEL632]
MRFTKALFAAVTLVSSTLAQDWHDGDGNGKIQWAMDCDFNGGDYAHYNIPDGRHWGITPWGAKGAVCGYKRQRNDGDECACCRNKPDGQAGVSGYAGYDYCKLVPDGVSCWADDHCASRHCRGNLGGLKRGTCKA